MALLQLVERCLQDAGYRTILSGEEPTTIYFEDYSLFGFGVIYDSVGSLLETWNSNQDEFLHRNAPFLRLAPRKAWNCYTLHLTDAVATSSEAQELFDIEENFTSTRKIARAGLITEAEVQRTLFPLIPIQNLLKMHGVLHVTDIEQRFHDWPKAPLKALLGSGAAEDIVEMLLEAE